jgi:hypothetical protein
MFLEKRSLRFLFCMGVVFFYMFFYFDFVAEASVKEMTLSGHTAEVLGIDISQDGKFGQWRERLCGKGLGSGKWRTA